MNKEKILKLINNYNGLEKEEKIKIDRHIDGVRSKMHDEYVFACEQDTELCAAYDELKKIKKILSFSLDNEFTEYSYTINESDPEAAEDIYEFSQKRFERSKEIAENLDSLLAELEQKLEDIKSRKIVLFKESKIAKIEECMQDYTSIANYYNDCMKRQAEKEYYLQNAKTLIDPYKKIYEERTEKYAKEVVERHIEKDPIIFCKRHESYISSTAHKRDFSSEPFNKACNTIREEVLFEVKQQDADLVK